MAMSGQERHDTKGRNAAAHPVASREVAEEARHRRALVLSEVAAEGTTALCRVLRQAAAGDPVAAGIPVTALVHASPGMTALDGHQLLRRAHIREADLAGDISPVQRTVLVELVENTERLRRAIHAPSGPQRAGLG